VSPIDIRGDRKRSRSNAGGSDGAVIDLTNDDDDDGDDIAVQKRVIDASSGGSCGGGDRKMARVGEKRDVGVRRRPGGSGCESKIDGGSLPRLENVPAAAAAVAATDANEGAKRTKYDRRVVAPSRYEPGVDLSESIRELRKLRAAPGLRDQQPKAGLAVGRIIKDKNGFDWDAVAWAGVTYGDECHDPELPAAARGPRTRGYMVRVRSPAPPHMVPCFLTDLSHSGAVSRRPVGLFLQRRVAGHVCVGGPVRVGHG
jgi:hypothetical protein